MISQSKFARKFRGENVGRKELQQLAYDLLFSDYYGVLQVGQVGDGRQITGILFLLT